MTNTFGSSDNWYALYAVQGIQMQHIYATLDAGSLVAIQGWLGSQTTSGLSQFVVSVTSDSIVGGRSLFGRGWELIPEG